MLNHIVLMGRLTDTPQCKKTPSDISVLSFTLACDRDYKNGDEKVCDFVNCTAWRGTAEFIERNFSKGRMMCVEGSLQSRKWEDKDGNKRTSWEVQVQNVYFADSKRDGSGQTPLGKPDEDYPVVENDGDLPF